jgi:Mg-chelatase subunit ChlD
MTGDKMIAAREAALAFLGAVDIGEDQVGVVTFSAKAQVVSPLSGDGSALEAAIRGIEVGYGTRIDLGLAAAQTVLGGPERRQANTPMIILLTDGIQMADPELPLDLATQIRGSKVELYIVGLGEDVDAPYLEAMAGDPQKLFLSPSPGDLAAIYKEIARLIPCSPDAFWGRR